MNELELGLGVGWEGRSFLKGGMCVEMTITLFNLTLFNFTYITSLELYLNFTLFKLYFVCFIVYFKGGDFFIVLLFISYIFV